MKYEALVKIHDSINKSLSPDDQASKLYKSGDIVVIKPKGWKWGRQEVKHFLIIELPNDIDEDEVELLTSPVSIDILEIDNEEGISTIGLDTNLDDVSRRIVPREMIRRRRHKIDIVDTLTNVLSDSPKSMNNHIKSVSNRDKEYQPLKDKPIRRTFIEDKTDRQDVKDIVVKAKEKVSKEIQDESFEMLPNSVSRLSSKKLRERKKISS